MEKVEFDVVVIGGGAVGLACAAHWAKVFPNDSILVLERHERLGSETTARNSEVIHAGFYYSAGSLKESLCIRGRDLLYEYCQKNEIAHRRCEKLVLGSGESDREVISKIMSNADRCQVRIQTLDSIDIRKLEPAVKGEFGFLSLDTGIICSESFVQTLERDASNAGVTILKNADAQNWEGNGPYWTYVKQNASDEFVVESRTVINSAGHGAYSLAKAIFGPNPPFFPRAVRGHYLSLSSRFRNCTSRLIYPIPDTKGGGLGIHLTLDLAGNCRLGPDVDWRFTDSPDHRFRDEEFERLREKFFQAGSRYLNDLRLDDLSPGFVGVRPKIVDSADKQLDFYIEEESRRGFSGWINLLGIESPGLTSSLAIAERVAKFRRS